MLDPCDFSSDWVDCNLSPLPFSIKALLVVLSCQWCSVGEGGKEWEKKEGRDYSFNHICLFTRLTTNAARPVVWRSGEAALLNWSLLISVLITVDISTDLSWYQYWSQFISVLISVHISTDLSSYQYWYLLISVLISVDISTDLSWYQ